MSWLSAVNAESLVDTLIAFSGGRLVRPSWVGSSTSIAMRGVGEVETEQDVILRSFCLSLSLLSTLMVRLISLQRVFLKRQI